MHKEPIGFCARAPVPELRSVDLKVFISLHLCIEFKSHIIDESKVALPVGIAMHEVEAPGR